ncbi:MULTISPECIES: ferritin-like domain-containing protein [Methanosarcina]|uniref:Bacterioferritin n=2 Tax=Methanosarcina barkeri TaxID=2208 RepID=A0A0E3LMI1_METBA|nr:MULTISPECIES: ferritin-like domain-containing protein [Methanosarcina]AKB53061.1 Bacterioferritin [Methanosarcina barkeri MS]AKB58833.1 Bacterioferritin [Methanosarcina barkeri 227]OED06357.1 hypothetical protein A9239_11845 [Methanosarcina sp. A14]
MAVKGYNEGIRLATELGDNNNKTFLESILKEEEEHVDWLETPLDQIGQIGIQTLSGTADLWIRKFLLRLYTFKRFLSRYS